METEAPKSMRERMDTDGYLVVPNVLSREEIVRLGKQIESHLTESWIECDCGKVQPHAAVTSPSIAWLFSHPGIVAALRGAMGTEDVVFTGDCNLHRNKLGNWHKDMGRVYGGYFRQDVFSAGDCRVLKVGLYLQDNDHPRTCFRVRRGSHREGSMDKGELVTVPTRAGDAVLFDVRLTHSGMLPDPVEEVIWRVSRRLSSPNAEARLGRYAKEFWWRLARKKDRLAIFFTYGARNAHTDEFTRNVRGALQLMRLPDAQKRLDAKLVDSLRQSGIGIASDA